MLDAAQQPPGCPQNCKNNLPDYACPVRTSENCLFLNVYTPHMNGSSPHLRATNASQNALPVMVFIHGVMGAAAHLCACTLGSLAIAAWPLRQGRYDKGSIDSCLYDGHYLAHRGNLVVVTLQYRLGALGFLHVEGSDIDANFAILVRCTKSTSCACHIPLTCARARPAGPTPGSALGAAEHWRFRW